MKWNSVGFYNFCLRPPIIHENFIEEHEVPGTAATADENDVPENNPKYKFKLDWVYGCLFNPTSNYNMFQAKNDLLVYPVSMTIVIYDRINETQRHYTDHTDQVSISSTFT